MLCYTNTKTFPHFTTTDEYLQEEGGVEVGGGAIRVEMNVVVSLSELARSDALGVLQ